MKKEKYERRQGMRENKKREIKGRRKQLETQEKVGHTKRKKRKKISMKRKTKIRRNNTNFRLRKDSYLSIICFVTPQNKT